ncbi:MAG: sucrase ferredoxin [Cyanobacteria bacterium J06649_4]
MTPNTATARSPATPFPAKIAQPCQYCSETSQANGEDPIGTAVTAKLWLFIEVPQPWAKNPWANESAELLQVFEQIEKQLKLWRDLRILAIAPDKTYSTSEDRHLFFYTQPSGAASEYAQQHYHLPTEDLCALVRLLALGAAATPLEHSAESIIDRFHQYRRPPTRAFFVCTHTRYDLACGRFGTPLYRLLRKRYADPDKLSVWQTTHFGGHNFAPTLIDFPSGHFWGHLQPEVLDTLVHRTGDVAELGPFYRGWSGLEAWAQIAERSLWMQHGWQWLNLRKSARIVRQDSGRLSHRLLRWILPWIPSIRAQVLLKKLNKKLAWAEVEVCWEVEGTTKCDRLRIERSHTVTSQMKSGTEAALVPVQQYRTKSIG